MAIITVKFHGIDNWNRPIFKDIKSRRYYGSTEKLFSYDATAKQIIAKVSASDLTYFGSYFNCEPMGTKLGGVIVIKEVDTSVVNKKLDLYHRRKTWRGH